MISCLVWYNGPFPAETAAIGFDSSSEFLFTDGSFGKNIIFKADMSSPVHIDNKTKDILNIGEGLTQGFDDTTLTAKPTIRKKICITSTL